MQHELAPDPTVAPHPLDVLLTGESGAAGHSPTRSPDLQLCPACRGRFVVPGEVLEIVDELRLQIELVCTACGHLQIAIHTDEILTEFECDLDLGFAHLVALLETVQQANVEEEIARFATALAVDAILPADF